MLGVALAGLLIAAACGWVVYMYVSPAGAVWHGDTSRVPDIPRIWAQPPARTYFGLLSWLVPWFGGVGVVGLVTVFRVVTGQNGMALVLFQVGAIIMLVGLPGILVHIFIAIFNRPHFLIPPSCRRRTRKTSTRRDSAPYPGRSTVPVPPDARSSTPAARRQGRFRARP